MTKLQRAAKHIGAVSIGRGQWAHYADETGYYYVVSGAELRELYDYLDSDDEQISSDAYSHWCAGTAAKEMPKDWTPDNRDAVVMVTERLTA